MGLLLAAFGGGGKGVITLSPSLAGDCRKQEEEERSCKAEYLHYSIPKYSL